MMVVVSSEPIKARFDQGRGKGFMPRFKLNRWWVFMFAVGIALSIAAAAPHHASAGTASSGYVSSGDDGSGGGGVGIGDPDCPTNPTKTALRGGVKAPSQFGARSVGTASGNAFMNRLRVVLQSLRLRLLGY
jgi:hypothetical protein